jgi:hypothetical protein
MGLPHAYINRFTVLVFTNPDYRLPNGTKPREFVLVTCYYSKSADYWECPNPDNLALVEASKRSMEDRFFTHTEDIMVPREIFDSHNSIWEIPPPIQWYSNQLKL